jgi:hypothetical protein
MMPPDEIDQRPVSGPAFENLDRLFEATYPYQDYFETAVRLGGSKLDSRTVVATPHVLNDKRTFRTDDSLIRATLVAVTENVYFWAEEGLDVDRAALAVAADRLQNAYYPRIVDLFGQEWRPGVDNDPHFSVLHLVGSTSSDELGYFTKVDEFPQALYSESNEQEIIYLNMAQLELDSDFYYGTLLHELQHLIQWYVDPNETTWLNEGLSQLAELHAGYETADPYEFHLRPEIRLNRWDFDDATIDAHYGAAYLFSVYLWEQLGEPAVQELSRHPANGLASVRSVLQGFRPDGSLEQFVADWVAANFLDDPAAGPRFYYRNLDVDRPSYEMRVDDLPLDTVKTLNQFGTHYINLDLRGKISISFAGDTIAELINVAPPNGEKVWFVPGVDDADAQLTAEFDLTGLDQATLKFSSWYELEEDYDFAYVAISSDNGDTWELLTPDHGTAGEFGPAFNGHSIEERDTDDGWVKESISLDDYVGRPVQLRFEVLTDYETDHLGTGRGFAVDDISIPELGYETDVEEGTGGWLASGFVQTGWQLPQQWAILFIEGGPQPRVTQLPLNQLNQGQWTIEVGKGGGALAIVPLTPFIDDMATYWLHIDE